MTADDSSTRQYAEHILQLLHIIAAAETPEPSANNAARAAFASLCTMLGERAAWILVARFPPSVQHTLTTPTHQPHQATAPPRHSPPVRRSLDIETSPEEWTMFL